MTLNAYQQEKLFHFYAKNLPNYILPTTGKTFFPFFVTNCVVRVLNTALDPDKY